MIGEIRFEPINDLNLNIFKLNVARPKDLLKLKVFAIDSWLMGMPANEPYTRTKDFEDIQSLMNHLNIDINKLKFETEEYILMPETYLLIDEYNKTGKNKLTNLISQKINLEKFENNNSSDIINRFSTENHTSIESELDKIINETKNNSSTIKLPGE
jgi:hypothetical protein